MTDKTVDNELHIAARGISANGRDCKHGQLARSCEICELDENLCDANLAKENAYQAGVRFGQRTTQRAYEIAIERGWLVKTVEHPVTLGESTPSGFDESFGTYIHDLKRALAARDKKIERVRKLHHPDTGSSVPQRHKTCHECNKAYPCPTIKGLNHA